MRSARSILALLLASVAAADAPGNVLLIVLDDVGIDRIAAYGVHPEPCRTPNIDRLADEGVLFRNVWANPFCSATRATILTGRYGFRTGIGKLVLANDYRGAGLELDEWTLPEVLSFGSRGAYWSAAVGKWHLGTTSQGQEHPNRSGFDHFAGTMWNLGPDGDGYTKWFKTVDGEVAKSSGYATSVTVDDSIRAIQKRGEEPWFLYVAFHAAHVPFHVPPASLHGRELSGDPKDSPVEHYAAMVEAVDREIGRLIAGIEPGVRARTTILVVGDNGTPSRVTPPPLVARQGKGSLYEGGVRVPLLVSGRGVNAPGRECSALVNTTDVFAAVVELCGLDARAVVPDGIVLDSISFVPHLASTGAEPVREFAYAEKFEPNHTQEPSTSVRTIRDARWKAIHDVVADEWSLYDLKADPLEAQDLATEDAMSDEAREALKSLRDRLRTLVD